MRFFNDQVGLGSFSVDLFYTLGAVAVILVVLALGLVDALTRALNGTSLRPHWHGLLPSRK